MYIPKPKDILGYTIIELESFMTPACVKEFEAYMGGQTVCVNEKDEIIYYLNDVERFLSGQPQLD